MVEGDIDLMVYIEDEPTIRELGNFLQFSGTIYAFLELRYEYSELAYYDYIDRDQHAAAPVAPLEDVIEEPSEYGTETELDEYESQAFGHETGYEISLEAEVNGILANLTAAGALNDLQRNWEHYAYTSDAPDIEIERVSSGSPVFLLGAGTLAGVVGFSFLMNLENESGDRIVCVQGKKVIHRISDLGEALERGKNITGQGWGIWDD